MPKESEYNSGNANTVGNLNVDRWHYDKETNQCKNFKYGGIGGNSNNFKSKADCDNICTKELYHLDLSENGTRCNNLDCGALNLGTE